jgi:hypothetical protein
MICVQVLNAVNYKSKGSQIKSLNKIFVLGEKNDIWKHLHC